MARIRAVLWVSLDQDTGLQQVRSYEVEAGGELYVPDDPPDGSPPDLFLWLNVGWRFAPLSYQTTMNSTTVIALEWGSL